MESRKENTLYHIVQALRQLYQGDPSIVWLIFGKNILEGVFDGICGVFYEKKYAGELRLYPMAQVLFGLHQERIWT